MTLENRNNSNTSETRKYISNKFWNVPHQNYSAVDSYNKNCCDDKTRFPKDCSQQGRPCVKTQPLKVQSGVGTSGQKSNVETVRMEIGNTGVRERNKTFQRRRCI